MPNDAKGTDEPEVERVLTFSSYDSEALLSAVHRHTCAAERYVRDSNVENVEEALTAQAKARGKKARAKAGRDVDGAYLAVSMRTLYDDLKSAVGAEAAEDFAEGKTFA